MYFGTKQASSHNFDTETSPLPHTFAYCRISTTDQTVENQRQEIANAGFAIATDRILSTTISGSTPASERPQFSKLLDRLEAKDVLIVTKLDRLGWSAMDVRATVDGLAHRGVCVHCLPLGGVGLTRPAGKMAMGVIAAVAEFERDLLIERTQTGFARAKASGKTLGRPAALTQAQREEVLKARQEGRSLGELAKIFRVSRAAIQRIDKSCVNSSTS